MVVFLIGYMGSGKSTIGKALAKQLGYKFVDTDDLIEKSINMPIKDYFLKEGENAFRHLESSVLSEFSSSDSNVIVATGGGLPCFNNNMEVINSIGLSIYLKVSISSIVERLREDRDRPLVQNKTKFELEKYVSEHLRGRRRFYKKAQIKVWNRGTKLEVLNRLIKKISNKSV